MRKELGRILLVLGVAAVIVMIVSSGGVSIAAAVFAAVFLCLGILVQAKRRLHAIRR